MFAHRQETNQQSEPFWSFTKRSRVNKVNLMSTTFHASQDGSSEITVWELLHLFGPN